MSTFTFQAPNTEVHVIAYNKQSYYKLADIMEGLTLISESDTLARFPEKAFMKFPRNPLQKQTTYIKGDWLPSAFELCRNRKAIEFIKFMNREVIPTVDKTLREERLTRKASPKAKPAAPVGEVLKAEILPPQAEPVVPAFQPQQLSLPIDTLESQNPVQVFTSDQFGDLRVVMRNDEPWFVTVDVCRVLEVKNPSQAVARLDEDEKMTLKINEGHSGRNGGAQMMGIVSEAGFYRLSLGARKPQARAFQRWVAHDVIPSIRKHGMYATPNTLKQMIESPDFTRTILEALVAEQTKNAALQQYNAELSNQIETNAPKVAFADAVEDRGENLGLAAFAKLLYDDETPVGRTRLIRWLRANGYFIQDAPLPYQRYVENGWFTIRLKELPNGNVATVTLITPRGQLALTNAFKKLAQLA